MNPSLSTKTFFMELENPPKVLHLSREPFVGFAFPRQILRAWQTVLCLGKRLVFSASSASSGQTVLEHDRNTNEVPTTCIVCISDIHGHTDRTLTT